MSGACYSGSLFWIIVIFLCLAFWGKKEQRKQTREGVNIYFLLWTNTMILKSQHDTALANLNPAIFCTFYVKFFQLFR